jgi:DNA-binding ferritin-like protein
MSDILARLLAIYHYAKDIHYSARGESFYGIHLLMDRVADGIHGQMDSINEVCYLGKDKEAPMSTIILQSAMAKMPEMWSGNRENLEELRDLIGGTIENILEMIENGTDNMTSSEASLLDEITQSLMLKKGLISRSLKE